MAASETILGKRQNRREFDRLRFRKNSPVPWKRSFLVSVFLTKQGKRFFTDPIGGPPFCDPRPSVLYRIRVYPKKAA